MKEVLKRGMLKFENSFFSHVVRCALGMIIPLVLTGGISGRPIPDVSDAGGWEMVL